MLAEILSNPEYISFVTNLIIPVVLLFSITYGLLRKTGLLGENERIYVIVSLAFALFFVYKQRYVVMTQAFSAVISYTLLAFLAFLMISSFIWGKKVMLSKFSPFIYLFVLALAGIAFYYAATYNILPAEASSAIQTGVQQFQSSISLDEKDIAIIVFLGISILTLIWLTSKPKTGRSVKEKVANALKTLAEAFGAEEE